MFSLNSNKKRGLSLPILASLIILIFTMIVIFGISGNIYDLVRENSKERECLTLINNIDRIAVAGNSNELRRRYEEACIISQMNLRNENQFRNEVLRCNSRAQRMINQERFIENSFETCGICSEIKSSFNLNIEVFEIIKNQEERDKIRDSTLRTKIESEEQILQFRIIQDKILFEIVENQEDVCSGFLN